MRCSAARRVRNRLTGERCRRTRWSGAADSRRHQAEPQRDVARIRAELDDAVVRVDEHHLRRPGPGLGVVEHPVADDDDHVARVDQMRGSAVDPDRAAAALAGDQRRWSAGRRW